MAVFSNYYFGPIAYYAQIIRHSKPWLESNENYQKQTYRNRCYILGANGRLSLVVPILHNGKKTIKDIQIAYDYQWQKEHIKSIQSAYQSSPYFEFYQDNLLSIYQNQPKYLWDFNLTTLDLINNKLNLQINYKLTNQYQTNHDLDYRNQYNAKDIQQYSDTEPYIQVFQEKFQFTPNLSILDLLCNKGPESSTYLKQFFKPLSDE